MSDLLNTNLGSVLGAFKGGKASSVINAIQNASANTGVDFSYLVNQAKAESNFNPEAKAKTSSASGLYQFIESTWMGMVDKHGAKYGIDTDGMSRSDILKLRFDPDVAANMAAEFASENKDHLERNWGGDIGPTELYFAHFMGAGGATSFLKARDENPLQIAANLFPKAAKANYNVFYDRKTGNAKSLEEVYQFFDKKFQSTESNDNTIESVMPAPQKPNSSLFNPDVAQNQTTQQQQQQQQSNHRSSIFRKRNTNPMPLYNLVTSPVELMILADMDNSLYTKSTKGSPLSDKSKLF